MTSDDFVAWAAHLRRTYGIADPVAPETGADVFNPWDDDAHSSD